MIKSSDIRDALSDLIKVKAGLPLKVFFNHVNNASEDYAWIRLRPRRKDLGFGSFDRKIRVDIQVVLAPDENGEIQHTRLYSIIDALDDATCGSIQILDRHITIYDAETIIFDDILTYTFTLDFNDCLQRYADEAASYEFMRRLELDFNGDTLIVDDENTTP